MGHSPAARPDAPPEDAAGELTVSFKIDPHGDIDWANSIVIGERSHITRTRERGNEWRSVKANPGCGHAIWLEVGQGLVYWAHGCVAYCDDCALAMGLVSYDHVT